MKTMAEGMEARDLNSRKDKRSHVEDSQMKVTFEDFLDFAV